MSFAERVWSSRWTRAGLAVLAVGWIPLLLYVAYELLTSAKGNPVGLGLLMVCSTPVGLGLIAVGVARAVIAARAEARR